MAVGESEACRPVPAQPKKGGDIKCQEAMVQALRAKVPGQAGPGWEPIVDWDYKEARGEPKCVDQWRPDRTVPASVTVAAGRFRM